MRTEMYVHICKERPLSYSAEWKDSHKNQTPSGNQLGAARQPVKLDTIMKTYEAEVKVT